ncbi:hypothetical protein ABEX47_30340, partial [Paenibacillus ehimensis]|uniref:hypothetical protein n=1 Tax=Paenibacillus ehimensis TaxID=79264 RepID=UPI003D27184A
NIESSTKVTSKVDFKKVYSDVNNIKHEVTEENQKEIENLKNRDVKDKYGAKNSDISMLGMGSKDDGIFHAHSFITYGGLTYTGKEYKYTYWLYYEWKGVPFFYFTDSVAQAWQSHTTTVGGSGNHIYHPFCTNSSGDQTFSINYEQKQLYASKGNLDLLGSGCNTLSQYGTFKDEVRIPISHNGETGSFVAGYAHPYSNKITKAVLNYVSISWDDSWGDEYTWTNTFTIGTTS